MSPSPLRLIYSVLALALFFSFVCHAQEQIPEEALAIMVAGAKTESDGAALLDARKELVTPALVKALGAQALKVALQGKFPQALVVYRVALDVARKIEDKTGTASSLYGMGQIHSMLDDVELAATEFNESLALRRELGDSGGMGAALNQLGVLQSKQGNHERALEFYQESQSLLEKSGNKLELSNLMNNIGNAYRGQGIHERAFEFYNQAMKLADEAGSQARVAIALGNVAQIHTMMGNYALALEAHQKSLKIKEAQGNKPGIANSHSNIGEIYRLQGNYEVAQEFFEKALKEFQEVGGKQGSAHALNNIGLVHQAQGNIPLAVEFYQKALKDFEEMKDKAGIAEAQNNLGLAERESGHYEAALELYRRSLAQSQEANDRLRIAQALVNIADINLRQNKQRDALQFAERAAKVAAEVGSRETLWFARNVAGKAYRALGQPEQARQAFDDAVKEIEAIRSQVSGGEHEQQSFFENKVSPYYEMIGLLVSQNRLREALVFAERAKGRVLLDVLQTGRANVTKSMTDSERERERKLTNEMTSLNAQLTRLRLERQPDAKHIGDLEALVQQARLDHEAFTNSLYAAHPDLRLKRGEAAHILNESQAGELLDAKTALLEYVITEDNAFLFVLTQGGRGKQERADLKLYKVAVGRKDLAARVEKFRRSLADRDPGFAATARSLYELLVAPARDQIRGKVNLIIVPDDSLWELPFQALRDSPDSFLIEQSALSYAPSLSVLREIRRPRKASPSSGHSENTTLLAFGNPTFGNLTIERAKIVLRSGATLEQLPEAENEVKSLAQLYGAGQSRVYTGAEAREGRAKEEAGKFSILHFATHGVLNDASPMYSHIVLSQGDKNGGEDGLLEGWEIMKLDLNADLVVLSACETARGRVGAGEGMIGLTWALFVAGSPSTLVSQWKVDSAATKLLMLDFHRGLRLGIGVSRTRASKSEALRQAALKMMRSGDYGHPFYWAGFIMVGDSR